MKESGHAAHTFARWRLRDLGLDDAVFSRQQVHVHIPAGAIPKDGPSAGVAIATAIVSLATGIAVRPDVAMTGEITLRGRVLAVGGVREKALAALREGIRTVILPERNLPDLEEIPQELKRHIRFVPVRHMDEVLEAALASSLPRTQALGSRPPRPSRIASAR
jgi:ATP-dependent Lon protease